MIYMRGCGQIIRPVGQLTGDRAGPDNSLPHFMLHEDHYKALCLHGARGTASFSADRNTTPTKSRCATTTGGEWRIEKQRLRWDVLDAFAEAANQAGIPTRQTSTPAPTKAWVTSRSTQGWLALEHRQGVLRPTCFERPNFEMWTAPRCKLVVNSRPTAASAAPAQTWDGLAAQ
jgi:choline dehydrogenase